MITFESLNSLKKFREENKFFTADEVADYPEYGVDDIDSNKQFKIKLRPWVNTEDRPYILRTSQYSITAKNTIAQDIPMHVAQEIMCMLKKYHMGAIETLISDFKEYMKSRLAGLDIQPSSRSDYSEVKFFCGDTWPEPLRHDTAFGVPKYRLILDSVRTSVDGDSLECRFDKNNDGITGYGVREIDCLHFGVRQVDSYNSFGHIGGDDCTNRLVSYMAKLRKVAELMDEAGKLVYEGMKLEDDADLEE